MFRFCCLASCVAWLGGCVSPSSVSPVNQGIVGGTNDTADPSVLLLIAQVPGSQTASLCTSEVVSPHVVITAAHCVDPDVVGMGNKFELFLGSDINNTAQMTAQNFVSVKETHYDTKFNAQQLDGGHDIAVVITGSALPMPPLLMNRTPLTSSMQGSSLRLVGFGITSGTDTMGMTAGTKRTTMVTLDSVDPLLIGFGNAQHDTCEGDSGGPAFLTMNGQEVIAGVTSFGDQGCTQGGFDTRVDVYASSFVDPYIAMFDPGSANGSPPDMSQGADMGSSGSPAPGQTGASCDDKSQCKSGVCAKNDSGGGYCTQSCDPSQSNACPSGLTCGEIDSQHYCVRSSGGCSFTPGASGPMGLAFGLLFLLATLLRRRRAR
jgi:secreted trypsin-like serine protease